MKRTHKYWTTNEYRFVRDNLHLTDIQLGEKLGRSAYSVEGLRKRNNLIKPNNQFEKGCQVWNKGIKFNAGGRSIETRFVKGHEPANTKKDFDVVIRNDTGKQYKFIRTKKGKWIPLHRFVWEQINGEIPKGSIIVFKDKDTMNYEIENLECITRQENLTRNLNREKASIAMKHHWNMCRTYEIFGLRTSRHKAFSKQNCQ